MSALGLEAFPVATQTYPRKQDYRVLSALAGLGASLYKFAFDLRVLQSPPIGEWAEPFGSRQVGSSAMPFKRNPIHAENMDSLARYLAALPRVAWDNAAHNLLERTLDDSANRRSLLPEAFLIADELLRRGLRLIEGLRINRDASERLLAAYGPFAATERLLMELVKRGGDRQELHEIIREHAMTAWAEVQAGRSNPLIESLCRDSRITHHASRDHLLAWLDASDYVGDAPERGARVRRAAAADPARIGGGMKLSLILAHPGPGSFNHAIAETARQTLLRNGHTVFFHDLYAEGFDPILPAHEIPKDAALPAEIARHCAEIAAADGIIVVHPNWWGQPPAILKGWIDRVIRPGVAYEFLESDVRRGCAARTAARHGRPLVFNTTQHPPRARKTGFRRSAGNPVEELRFRTVRRERLPSPCLRRDRHEHSRTARRLAGGSRRDAGSLLSCCWPGRQAGATDAGLCHRPRPTGDARRRGGSRPRLLCRAARPGGNCQAAGTGRSRGAWFSNGAVTLHLGVEQDFRPARKAHPALLVEGLTTFVARLEAAGYPIQRDVQFAGYDRVHVNDPFGNRIELMERTA